MNNHGQQQTATTPNPHAVYYITRGVMRDAYRPLGRDLLLTFTLMVGMGVSLFKNPQAFVPIALVGAVGKALCCRWTRREFLDLKEKFAVATEGLSDEQIKTLQPIATLIEKTDMKPFSGDYVREFASEKPLISGFIAFSPIIHPAFTALIVSSEVAAERSRKIHPIGMAARKQYEQEIAPS